MDNKNLAKTACGLPSQVVLSMAGRAVQRTEVEWRELLTPEQYRVTRLQGTEPPFRNEYWNHHADGVYFSVGSETPLFDSRDKFESGTGWPSFTRPLEAKLVAAQVDESHGQRRIEVHCAVDGGHLGHVFEDGPEPTGLRFCINSAALRFMARADFTAWVRRQEEGTKGATGMALS